LLLLFTLYGELESMVIHILSMQQWRYQKFASPGNTSTWGSQVGSSRVQIPPETEQF